MDLIVGTAGHIDHGKTSLVRALTGVDTDRLPEEKRRGITIDLGFVELALDGVRIGFVDVPGHERFIKNMLAGASGIDAVILVVAADEGVMPQTREHFDICRLLDIKHGIVVITKADTVDAETSALVELEVSELVAGTFLADAEVVVASSKSGEGLEALIHALHKLAARIPTRSSEVVARLPIDRAFTVKGFGTVVTGTLVSGTVSVGEELDLVPSMKKVRVRGIQSHGESVETAHAGRRTAINIGGADHSEISRGMMLAESGALVPSQAVDAWVHLLADAKSPLRSRQRVRVHVGTVEALARLTVIDETDSIEPGSSAFVQLRFEKPVAPVPDERFIIRLYSPQTTVAGGVVLDNSPARHRRREFDSVLGFLKKTMDGSPRDRIRSMISSTAEHGASLSELTARSGLKAASIGNIIDGLTAEGVVVAAESVFLDLVHFESLKKRVMDDLELFHSKDPLAKGLPLASLREKRFPGGRPSVFKSVLDSLSREGKLLIEKDVIVSGSKSSALSPEEVVVKEFLSDSFKRAGLAVPKLDEVLRDAAALSKLPPVHIRKVFQLLVDGGELIKVSDEFYFRADSVEGLVTGLKAHAEKSGDRKIDVPKFKELAGLSRKYAIPLLEYFDRERITQRIGDSRVIL
jgi:selenocysteine-specific elongation factor